jgi:hypothetical protein
MQTWQLIHCSPCYSLPTGAVHWRHMRVLGPHPPACCCHLERRFLSTRSTPRPCLASSPPIGLSRCMYQFLCVSHFKVIYTKLREHLRFAHSRRDQPHVTQHHAQWHRLPVTLWHRSQKTVLWIQLKRDCSPAAPVCAGSLLKAWCTKGSFTSLTTYDSQVSYLTQCHSTVRVLYKEQCVCAVNGGQYRTICTL